MRHSICRLSAGRSLLVTSVSPFQSFCSHHSPGPSSIPQQDNELIDLSKAGQSFPSENVCVVPDFITEEEHDTLVKESQQGLRRRDYEDAHWDGVIHAYREMEKSRWSKMAQMALQRVRQYQPIIPKKTMFLPGVHVLDLAPHGYIEPHVDSQIASGDIIAGLSLLSASIMRLKPDPAQDHMLAESNTGSEVSLLLPPRSLYVLSGSARYNYTHEILPGKSMFGEVDVHRQQRISIMFRDLHEDDIKSIYGNSATHTSDGH